MSHTNSTTHYSLPQFVTTDKPAWLTDVNNAYVAIDTGIHNAKKAGDDAQADATQALSDAGAAQSTANGADGKASGAIASLSEAFLDSSTYDVGDLVIYNNLLYICHTAVTVPGAWTGVSNWSRTDIDSQMIRNLADLNDVSLSSPTQGEVLGFDSNGKWSNKSIGFTKIGTLTDNGVGIDVTNYNEFVILPVLATTRYTPSTCLKAFLDIDTHLVVYQSSTHTWIGAIKVASNILTYRQVALSGWNSAHVEVYAR